MSDTVSALIEVGREVLVGPHRLPGLFAVPDRPAGLVVFAHGSGSSRLSSRNQYVAAVLYRAGIGVLLFDLLMESEAGDRSNVFDIGLLADRLLEATDWAAQQPETAALEFGYFGASTGAAAALVAAARRPEGLAAVVSRGGRPDLAREHLPRVAAPTLLIVGGRDEPVLDWNREALELLNCPKRLVVIPGATHLFPEPGALDEVARLARDWFLEHFEAAPQRARAQSEPTRDGPDDPDPLFRDREDAARQLALKLKELPLERPLVLGIPRGGAVTGASLARQLGADFDITLARKLRAPFQPELAIGAVGEDGTVHLDPRAFEIPGVSQPYIEQEKQYQLQEIARRQKLYRGGRSPAPLHDRTVIVTDDGIATGSTMIAALQVVRHQKPRELIAAIPVAPPNRLDAVREHCDRVVCLYAPPDFWAVGQFYEQFEQVDDQRVIALLQEFAQQAE